VLQASGVTVSDACKTTYEEIKKDKKHRYVVFYIKDEKQIDVEFIGKFGAARVLSQGCLEAGLGDAPAMRISKLEFSFLSGPPFVGKPSARRHKAITYPTLPKLNSVVEPSGVEWWRSEALSACASRVI